MYTDVVVLTYQSPDIDTYTYEIPKNLDVVVGQLVSVPFGKRNPYGIVLGSRSDLNQDASEPRSDLLANRVKPISSVVLREPLLLPYQIELLKWMGKFYHASMAKCLEAMLPQIPSAKRLESRSDLSQVLSKSRSDLFTGQTLVLVPSINHLPQAMARFDAKNFVIYSSELKISKRFEAWQKIASGPVDHIFGTRSAIFTPCPKLTSIIIFDEHDDAYKDQRSPYFNTLTVAEKISQLTGAKLKITDSAPRITTYFTHGTRFNLVSRLNLVKTKIVSMLEEKAAGNRSSISSILEEYIERGFEKNKKILLFLNKKAESGHVYCKTCKYSEFAKVEPDRCPSCQSHDIYFNSTNVKTLATLVKKIVPRARVNLITSKSRSVLFSRSALVKDGPFGLAKDGPLPDTDLFPGDESQTIDIATASVFYSQKSSAYKLLTQKYDLVAHIQTDSLLNIIDFSSAEKLYAQISNLKKITKGLLLLQTYNPQDTTISAAADGNYQKFYQAQISERKALTYPPFALLVKLSVKGKKGKNVEEKAQKVFEELNQLIQGPSFLPGDALVKDGPFGLLPTTNYKLPTILGPYKPTFSGKRAKYNIILKIPTSGYLLGDREKALKSANPLLLKVPKDWQVEIEPEGTSD